MHKHEQRILEALCNNLAAAGFKPAAVYTRDDYLMRDTDGTIVETDGKWDNCVPMTTAEIIKTFEDYDMYCPTIHFTDQHKTTWGNGVMVVEGNLADFISDWHCGNKAFDAIVNEVATAAGDGVFE